MYVEDIQQLVYELVNLEVEFPRHLMEPIFIICNEKISQAIETEHLYSLEILLDTLSMINARNIPGEQKYAKLAEEA